MSTFTKKLVAEFIGTFMLVFLGTGAAVLNNGTEGLGVLGIAVAFGLTIVAAAYSIGNISGAHLNPAVSAAAYLSNRITEKDLIGYTISQLLGAFTASGFLAVIVQNLKLDAGNLGQNISNVSPWLGVAVEALLTFIFVLVILTVTSKEYGQKHAGLIIGATLVLIHFVGIPLTGMSANPARSIAPAIFVGGEAIKQCWIFIVGPYIGALLAYFVGDKLLGTSTKGKREA